MLLLLCSPMGQATPVPAQPGLFVWQVDSMQKVFKDNVPPARTNPVLIEAARNEVVSGQVVVWSTEKMDGLVCRAGAFTLEKAGQIPAPRVRYAGYVPMSNKPSRRGALRPRPCDYPDPLYDRPGAAIPPKTAQPIWLTIKVPSNSAPGLYKGIVEVEAKVGGVPRKQAIPIQVQVYAATLSDKRTIKESNWMWFDSPEVTRHCGVNEIYSEPFWKLMENVAKDMGEHRNNVIFTPTTAHTWNNSDRSKAKDLIEAKVGSNGALEFDFTRFDRWVSIFQAAGRDVMFEGYPLCKKHGKKVVYYSVVWNIKNGKAVREEVLSVSPEYQKYLSVFLPAFKAHLKKIGLFDHYIQHILDEPNGDRKPVYVQIAKWFKQYAPGIKIVEAVQISELEGSVDIWVPTLNKLAHSWSIYKGRQAKGEELWFYTMGRPVECALPQERLLQWACYATRTTGYLHWGYNWWQRSKDPNAGKWTLEPGDEWIVYPQKGGVVDSMRWESVLEGIQDYELLKALGARDVKTADAICAKLVQFGGGADRGCDFNTGVPELRAARRNLLQALSSKTK